MRFLASDWICYAGYTELPYRLREYFTPEECFYIIQENICIPSITFRGYFPQEGSRPKNYTGNKFAHGDRYINKLIRKNIPLDEAVATVLKDDFLTPEKVQSKLDISFSEMEKMEEGCDVTISDYFRRHYAERQLAYTTTHPTNEVLCEMARRILLHLGISNTEFINPQTVPSESGVILPIYPSVRKALGLQNCLNICRPNYYVWPFQGDDEAYLRAYIAECCSTNE